MMMELSYAQNLEDHHLAQVFGDQERGIYVDVGAGHPVADNVSFWFYLRGWRGLVIEPQKSLADLYAHVRPRDTAVCGLVGDRTGEAEFHQVERLHGFSTTVARHAEGAAAFGAGFETHRLPITTLAALCETYGIDTIDFLKVDVEGAEGDVLRGGNWRRWRPRVVIVEAIAPGSMAASFAEWEFLLLEQGYRFAFFDGLNRFYLASEAEALAARFPKEKASWDAVRHLYEFGRAPDNPDHPDHALARSLVNGFLAALPTLAQDRLTELVARAQAGACPLPPSELQSVLGLIEGDADRLRAALGRIAACYDGGQLLDD